MMFFELNVTVYWRWLWAPDDNTKRTLPSGLATVTSATAGRDRQTRTSGNRIDAFICVLLETGSLRSDIATCLASFWPGSANRDEPDGGTAARRNSSAYCTRLLTGMGAVARGATYNPAIS